MAKSILNLRRTMLFGAALAIGFLLTANTARAQALPPPQGVEPPETSVISQFWQSVASSVGSNIGSLIAGWALSAIGISSSTDQELADLTEIIDLLEQIDAELSTIETDFEDLKCEQAQNAEGLTNAITRIGGLYDRYTDYVHNYGQKHAIPDWEGSLGVQTWLDDIFDPTTGLQAQLIAMQNALTPPAGTGVISECVEFIVDAYRKSDGPTKAVFDWTGDARLRASTTSCSSSPTTTFSTRPRRPCCWSRLITSKPASISWATPLATIAIARSVAPRPRPRRPT